MDITLLNSFGILYRNFVRDTDEILKDTNISFSECIFLMNIGFSEGTNQEKLAQKLMIDRAAIARSVKSLAAKGYVRVERSQSDLRNKELYLTNIGRQMLNRISVYYEKRTQLMLEEVCPQEYQVFLSVLGKLTERVHELQA